MQAFGDNACHPEPIRFAQDKLRAGSGSSGKEILRFAQDDIRAHLWAKKSALGCKLERLQKIEKQWTLPYTLCRSARSRREILRFAQDDNSDRMTRLKRLRLIGINHPGGTLYGFDYCSRCTAARRRDHPLCVS